MPPKQRTKENKPRPKEFLNDKPKANEFDTTSESEELKPGRSIRLDEIEDFDEIIDFSFEVPLRKFVRSGGVLKRVYRQAVDFGSLPNTTTKGVDFPDTIAVALVDQIISVDAITVVSGSNRFPNSWYDGTNTTYWSVNVASTNLRAFCVTNWNATALNAKVIVEYTRTDR